MFTVILVTKENGRRLWGRSRNVISHIENIGEYRWVEGLAWCTLFNRSYLSYLFIILLEPLNLVYVCGRHYRMDNARCNAYKTLLLYIARSIPAYRLSGCLVFSKAVVHVCYAFYVYEA